MGARTFTHLRRQEAQHFVADIMAVLVVDLLEMIDVQRQRRIALIEQFELLEGQPRPRRLRRPVSGSVMEAA